MKKIVLILLLVALVGVFAVGVALEPNQAPAIQTAGVVMTNQASRVYEDAMTLLAAIGVAVAITVVLFYNYLRMDIKHRRPVYEQVVVPYLRP